MSRVLQFKTLQQKEAENSYHEPLKELTITDLIELMGGEKEFNNWELADPDDLITARREY